MIWRRIWVIVRKDLRELLGNRMVVLPMTIVPLMFCVAMPALLTGIGLSAGSLQNLNGQQLLERMLAFYAIPPVLPTLPARMIYVVLNYTFIPMFMIVPLMASSIISANAIVGEKERKTLETLLYTPVTNREFIVAKLLGPFLPAVAIAWIGFVGYFAAANIVSLVMIHTLMIRSWIWLPALLLLAPAVSAIGLSATLAVSLKAKSFMEAQQLGGAVVIPMILLVVIQITGVIVLNIFTLIAFALLLLAASYLIVMRVLPHFTREGIISTL
ncbi:MAG TPA: ABC transporter permease subunit [Spirochaetia bacterium]|nr:ABC transporter permease subunit [Spirochaetia bacterium]